MKRIKITQFFLPAYLAIILLLQLELTIDNIFLVGFPIIVLSFSFYFKKRTLAIIGLFLFYTLSLSTISISDIESYFQILMIIILIILPSLLLVGQAFDFDYKALYSFDGEKNPLIISLILLISIFIVFYLIVILLWDGFLLSTENIEAQILILIALSCSICLPLIMGQRIKNKKI